MFRFVAPKGCGKSAYCYKQARERNAYIIVNTGYNRVPYLAKKYEISPDHIITVGELLTGRHLPPNAEFLVDELEDVGQSLVGGKLIGYSSAEEKYE